MKRDDFGFPIIGIIGAVIFGVLMDFRPLPDEPTDDYAKRSWRRAIAASQFRWVAVFWVNAVVVWQVLGSHGALAPLLITTWLTVMNRLVASTGHTPSPRDAVARTRLGFFMLAVALLATLVSAVDRLLPLPVFPAVATWAAVVAGVVALADAWLTARALRAAQVPEAPDFADFDTVALILGMSSALYKASLADGSFEVVRAGDSLIARVPRDAATLLLDRAGMEERCREFRPGLEVASVDAPGFSIVLGPADERTKAARDAASRSNGLFAEHIGGGLDDLPVIDLELGDQPLPRLS